MKIIIKESKKREVLKEFEPVTIVAGAALLIGALFAFFASKFFGSYERGFTRIGENIDKESNNIKKALENEKAPEAKEAVKEIVDAQREVVEKLKDFKEKSTNIETAAKMEEKPSVAISKAITVYVEKVEKIVENIENKIKPQTLKQLKESFSRLGDYQYFIENIDLYMKLVNKGEEEGLWNKVIIGSPIEKQLDDGREWQKFASLLTRFV